MRKLAANCILNQATRLIICIPILLTTPIVVGELKTKSSKNLFRKLNEHSKELQSKQEEIMKKHNSLSVEYDELEHLKTNMNVYLGRTKTEEKKESVIGTIKKHKRKIDKTIEQSHSMSNDMEL